MNSQATVNQCVKCGLCLPHCPTFRLTGSEAESPRGRIALIQALEENQLEPSPGLLTHLDNCLECMSCEAMCPSNVRFGELMDTARSGLETIRKRSLYNKLLRRLGFRLITAGPFLRGWLTVSLKVYRSSGLQNLLRKSRLLHGHAQRLDRLLVRMPQTFKPVVKKHYPEQPITTVQLFTGCVSKIMDAEALHAASILLERLGYRVQTSNEQVCCGALHQHNGEPQTAQQLALANFKAYEKSLDQPIVSIASGCAAQLRSYSSLYHEQIPAGFTQRIVDINGFLVTHEHFSQLQFKSLNKTVAVHIPCSQRNVLDETDGIMQLLETIPDILLQKLDTKASCCGAAGSYCLTQPGLSDQLCENTLASLLERPPRYLVTSNTGCALHMAAMIENHGWKTEVLHPVTLLARQLTAI